MDLLLVFLLILILFLLDIGFISLWNLLNKRSFDFIHKQDSLIALTMFIVIAVSAYIFDFLIVPNLFIYFLLACITGIFLEFIFGFSWFKLMGSRLYRYYSKEFLGFTSLYVVPIWGLGGLVFLSCWNILVGDITTGYSLSFLVGVFILGGIFSATVVAIIGTVIKSFSKGFNLTKYIVLLASIWGGIISVSLVVGRDLIIYVLVSSLIGLILEIFMGLVFPSLFGQRLWIYKRFPILGGVSSYLMFPIWGIASITMFFLIQAVL